MESEIFSCLLRASAGFFLRFCLSWHYPKNSKPALSPHHDWLKTGSQRQNAPLRIWFYPQ
ncbi:serine/threonine protein kinase [Salmonella enterica]|uniref:Serine/threonine protein kinase n=1 Tax=Salmonella enterica subsp. enterica serovar Kentucky TaxID=192955 RepID=A0A637H571_SALET|nr:serine/threonine protein kinase [Escherichia coli]EBL3732819.1 serine/threonine protein kinase [Salmonella enterica subsp. enterica serovar Kentucky]EHF6949560.1 serine/threonine protein kinase [Salmonella enterica]EBO8557162.1 serine/threonine protein kinase [Salmonella enterica subsp. enterica serovar Kentucky]ECB5319460.1 serine/threonine protein kinase [Salmonella enterica subsp. enterica serovar Kentucky]ECU2419797.1 serine/threonine protein kinase [Salmonella enterica subsp. enterica 